MNINSPTPKAERQEMLCYCNQVTVADFVASLQDTSGSGGFEKALQRTNVGSKCTACLLDAEFLFVNSADYTASGAAQSQVTHAPQRSFRRKLWDFIDQFAPMAPYPLSEFSPVLRGKDLGTSICVANDRLKYNQALVAPRLKLEWQLFDATGHQVHRGHGIVESGEALKIPVSSFLPENVIDDSGLTMGSIRLKRRFLSPGVRGTTRPQIVLETSRSCCVVHVQGPNGAGNLEFNLLARGKSERVFLSLINPANRDLKFSATADILHGNELRCEWKTGEVIVPARNARLFEVKIGEHTDEDGNPRQTFLRWDSDGAHKAHVFCASTTLDQFSIDHP